jgi:hypothetical protein
MTILTQAEIDSIIVDVGTIIRDDVIGTSIVYKQSGSTVSDWDPTAGTIPAMWTTSSVSAFKGSYTLDEVSESGGLIEYSDVKFILMLSDVSGVLSTDDMIVESASATQSATTYQVKNIIRDPLAVCYFCQAKAI